MANELDEYISVINVMADELCKTITGNFDIIIQSSINNESIQKLIMMINFLLDGMRRKLDELETEMIEKESLIKKLEKLSRIDHLTGIPNRFALQEMLESELLKSQKNNTSFALAIIDIDSFKHINDQSGHHVGDLFLKAIASRIKNTLKKSDYLARAGGDEFALIFTELEQKDNSTQLVKRIYETLERPFKIKEQMLSCDISTGLAIYPSDAQTYNELFKHADLALYYSKHLGGKQFQFFSKQIYSDYIKKESISALLQQEFSSCFTLHFHPIYNINTTAPTLSHCECLLRTKQTHHQDISIIDIIQVAEERGMMIPLGRNIIELAFQKIKAFSTFLPDITFTINLSAMQLDKLSLLKTLSTLSRKYDIKPEMIAFEITETAFIKNEELMLLILNQIRTMGFHIAIDDFGKGYSALSRLKNFPADIIKIDMDFTKNIATDPQTQIIIKAIIQLSSFLNLHVICEGVETPNQLALLKEYGCKAVQGFLLSKPLDENTFIEQFSLKH